MTDCARARERIATMLSGEIDADERLRLERHLAGCAPCSQEAERLRGAFDLLADGDVPDPGPAYWAAFGGRLGRRLDAARRRARLVRWTAAAAAVGALVAGLAVVREGRRAPAAPRAALERGDGVGGGPSRAARGSVPGSTAGRAPTVEAAEARLREALRRAATDGEGPDEIDTLLDEIAPGDSIEGAGLAGPPTPEDERRLSGDLFDSRG